jgi:hypothetical protein
VAALVGLSRYVSPASLDSGRALAFYVLHAVFLWAAVVVILRELFQRKGVGGDNVLGAICGYLIAGAGWASLNEIAFWFDPTTFSINPDLTSLVADWQGRLALFLYYSLAQMMTIGYSDVTPLRAPATTLSLFAALFGLFYTAIVVAHSSGSRNPGAVAIETRRDRDEVSGTAGPGRRRARPPRTRVLGDRGRGSRGLVGTAFHLALEGAETRAQQGARVGASASDGRMARADVVGRCSGVHFALACPPLCAGGGRQRRSARRSGHPRRCRLARTRRRPVKFVGGVLALGAGLALGREGPTVQMGATIGHLWSRAFGLRAGESRVLLAAGAGAGSPRRSTRRSPGRSSCSKSCCAASSCALPSAPCRRAARRSSSCACCSATARVLGPADRRRTVSGVLSPSCGGRSLRTAGDRVQPNGRRRTRPRGARARLSRPKSSPL